MVDVLTPIWERVLQRPAIRQEDNFFDLGGDSLLAVELFTEIERVSGPRNGARYDLLRTDDCGSGRRPG